MVLFGPCVIPSKHGRSDGSTGGKKGEYICWRVHMKDGDNRVFFCAFLRPCLSGLLHAKALHYQWPTKLIQYRLTFWTQCSSINLGHQKNLASTASILSPAVPHIGPRGWVTCLTSRGKWQNQKVQFSWLSCLINQIAFLWKYFLLVYFGNGWRMMRWCFLLSVMLLGHQKDRFWPIKWSWEHLLVPVFLEWWAWVSIGSQCFWRLVLAL